MALLSRRQLLTIKNFGNTQYRLHVGPVGCGKTYSMCMAFGMKARFQKAGRYSAKAFDPGLWRSRQSQTWAGR